MRYLRHVIQQAAFEGTTDMTMTEKEAREAGLFVIEEIRWADAQAAFAKLATRTVKKLKLENPPALVEVARGLSEHVWIVDNGDHDERRSRMVPAVFARIEGEKPKLNGWSLGARLENLNNGERLISAVPGVTVPERFRLTGMECEHCGHRRDRKDVFVVAHDSGEWKQVGRSCLRDFLGHDPARLLAAYTGDATIREAFDAELRGLWSVPSYPVVEVLGYTAAAIRVDGWVSRKASGDTVNGYRRATADTVADCFGRGAGPQLERERLAPTDADKDLAARALAWVYEQEATNDYMHNLTAALRTPELDGRTFGVACSAIAAYMRAMNIKQEWQLRKEANAASEHVGTVKERLRNLTVTIEHVQFFESDFGGSTLVKMRAGANLLTWFASGSRGDLEPGMTATLTGTVKRHTEYKGTKETQLSRCVIDVAPAA